MRQPGSFALGHNEKEVMIKMTPNHETVSACGQRTDNPVDEPRRVIFKIPAGLRVDAYVVARGQSWMTLADRPLPHDVQFNVPVQMVRSMQGRSTRQPWAIVPTSNGDVGIPLDLLRRLHHANKIEYQTVP